MTTQPQRVSAGYVGPLAGTFAVQTIVSMAMFGVAVVAPVAAEDIGVNAELIGSFTAIAYAVGTVAGLMTGAAIARLGAIRVCQLTMLCVLAGTLALSLSNPLAAVASAVLLGLGYGPVNPVSTQILASVTTPRSRPLIFSVKQTGMPVGAALAGAMLPFLITLYGWEIAFVAVGILALVVAGAIGKLQATATAGGDSAQSFRLAILIEPLRICWRSPQLTCLMAVGCIYGGSQVAIATFYVIQLTTVLGLSLETSGLLYTLLQASAVAGRLLWGALAGWLVRGSHVLVGLGLATALLAICAGNYGVAWSLWEIGAISVLLGMTSHGFNGVMFAELTRHVPDRRIGHAASGLQFASMAGVALVPLLFGLIVTLSGDYLVAYACIAVAVLATAAYAAASLGAMHAGDDQ